MSDFPISWVRECFPALNLGDNFIFFDNGAGAQIPQAALDAVQKHLILRNVQRGGRYRQSVEVDEVAFGMNATSFIRIVSLAIADIMGARREIIVTDMDHEANIATWLVLEKRGVEVFIDAVHYAPHGPIDVQDLDCDYLVCSGYKIFAPHMGFLWGKAAALEALPTFREDFIPDKAPMKIEVGTFAYENVAGMDAAIGYIEDLGRRTAPNGHANKSRRAALVGAMQAIRHYEAKLSARLLKELQRLPRVSTYGVRDPEHIARRVPTICFNIGGVKPATVTSELADRAIGVRDGNMYSPRLLKRLGVSSDDGAVRASLVHYNTEEEINCFIAALGSLIENSA